MSINRKDLFSTLFRNFLNVNNETEAIIASDHEGFVIAGEKRSDLDLEIISFLTAVVNPVLERIRNEFSFQKFGTANFDTENHRLLFISVSESTTLSLVLDMMAWVDRVAPYAYLLAEKVAQIINAKEEEFSDIYIPEFKDDIDISLKETGIEEKVRFDKLAQGRDYTFKFIIIGDHEVGKTSLVRRFVDKKFSTDYRATIGLNIISHKFDSFGNKVSINLWDIGAQHYFKRFRKTYYDGAEACFIVFNITSKESFENVGVWHNELREFINNKDIPVIIIGNKIDLEEQRHVSYEEGLALAKNLSDLSSYYEKSALSEYSDLSKASKDINTKIAYVETSAKTGDRVEEAFNLITYNYMLKNTREEENLLKDEFVQLVSATLEYRDKMILTILSYDPFWSPCLDLISEIDELGNFSREKFKKKEKVLIFENGLVVKNFSMDSFKVEGSDVVFCLFDARGKEHINPEWIQLVQRIFSKLEENKVLSIGMRVDENLNWNQLVDEFDINDLIDEKFISVFFFKLEKNYRLEILKAFTTMYKSINELQFRI